jgi:chorismate mutase / prephenate dehydratase
MLNDEELQGIRTEIDAIDHDLLQLFNRRMALSQRVGELKAAKGLTLFDPGREEIIIERLGKLNRGLIKSESLRAIYREIFAASRLLQYGLEVAFLGPQWTYSYLAALSFFGHSARYLPHNTLEDVFDALLKKQANVAVVPIENSLQGGVGRTMDLLYERDVTVMHECYLEVAHYLSGHAEELGRIKHLYAHPQAIEQCRGWILENLGHVEIFECASTAQATQLAGKDPEAAAICNLYAAHHHGLKILAERIEDHGGNMTRFLALGNQFSSPSGSDKTSVLFAVSDQPGALHRAIEAFASTSVNMTRIESRPNRLFPWQYLFYADIEGHSQETGVASGLMALKERVTFLKVLGSYPKSDPKNPIRFEKEWIRA